MAYKQKRDFEEPLRKVLEEIERDSKMANKKQNKNQTKGYLNIIKKLEKITTEKECGKDYNCNKVKKEPIIISVNGGIAEVENNPSGYEIIIRDYDCENYDEDELEKDEDGNEYKRIES